MTSSPLARRSALVVSSGALALALSACGGSAPGESDEASSPSSTSSPSASSSSSSGSSAAPAEEHSSADVTFAQGMLVHHRGAITMSEVALERADDPRLEELAGRIIEAQGPEIDEMTSWLQAWDEPVPSGDGTSGMDGMSGMEGMDGGMAGMMGEEDMAALRSASGRTFDDMWLRGMIEHHRGAVEMSQTEIDEGQNPEAIELAKSIIDDQQAEIDEMEQMLAD